ncbi:MAG TPA: tail fiber protein [Solirubrobacteraceae bacterium]
MDPFLAEIRIFPYTFAPRGWALCDGRLLAISQFTTLFSLLGTYYGGDGKVTFALPNLQGAVPIHAAGNQPGRGLSSYSIGEEGGTESVTLQLSQTPVHTHSVTAQTIDPGDTRIPGPTLNLGNQNVYSTANPNAQLDPRALPPSGGGLPHSNLMPYLTFNFCIALSGLYPQRS